MKFKKEIQKDKLYYLREKGHRLIDEYLGLSGVVNITSRNRNNIYNILRARLGGKNPHFRYMTKVYQLNNAINELKILISEEKENLVRQELRQRMMSMPKWKTN